ncbi:MAG: hypothetical protein K5685_00725 [Bacteroidales bacterium]|nr:hypothetical protein [Bacteroidales bacterium]
MPAKEINYEGRYYRQGKRVEAVVNTLSISKDDDMAMRNRIESFRTESGTRCGLIPVWITTFGLKKNMYSADVQYQVVLDDLF